jgi:disulfide bond formation protein DsbB
MLMRFSVNFYRAGAVCSVVTAATTLLLIFLPGFFAPAEGFEGRMARVHDPAYQLRSWVYLVHPFLVLMAALAVAVRIRTFRPGLAVVGLIAMMLWAFTEAAQQGMTLYAFDKWRVAFATADEATRAQIRTLTLMYDGLWDGMYFVLLIGFAIGNLCFGLALARLQGLGRVVGVFFLAACLLTISLIWREIGWGELPEPLASWSYPVIQPLGRTLIGVWLWRVADESSAASAYGATGDAAR